MGKRTWRVQCAVTPVSLEREDQKLVERTRAMWGFPFRRIRSGLMGYFPIDEGCPIPSQPDVSGIWRSNRSHEVFFVSTVLFFSFILFFFVS